MTTGNGEGTAHDATVTTGGGKPMDADERAGIRAWIAYQIEDFRRRQAEQAGSEYVPLSEDELAGRVQQKVTAAVAHHATVVAAAKTAATVNAPAAIEEARAHLAAAEAAAESAAETAAREAAEAELALKIAGGD